VENPGKASSADGANLTGESLRLSTGQALLKACLLLIQIMNLGEKDENTRKFEIREDR
jgi:hypothetical protein